MRFASLGAGILTAVAFVVAGAFYYLAVYGISSDGLRQQAAEALSEIVGVDVAVTLGPARLSFSGPGLLGVRTEDVVLADRETGRTMVQAGGVEFGIEALPLLSGRLELGSVEIVDARVDVVALPSTGGGDWARSFQNGDGLFDPRLVVGEAIDGAKGLFATMMRGEARTLKLSNVVVQVSDSGPLRTLLVEDATLAANDDENVALSLSLKSGERQLDVAATGTRDPESERITSLEVQAKSEAVESESATDEGDRIGTVEVKLTGFEGIQGRPSMLAASIKVGQSRVWIDRKDNIVGALDTLVSLSSDDSSVDVERLLYVNGRTSLDFHGRVAPRAPVGDAGPTYRVELISDRSVSAPMDSQEPALDFVARLAGAYRPESRILALDEIGVRTEAGELTASVEVNFEPGVKPGIKLSARVPSMAVSHVKQLWPHFAASGARRWALNHLFGGTISESELEYRVAPGRLGNGVPLKHDEVFGQFNIREARFDVTGDIPPVREAVGSISFKGNDVNVALASGVAYLPSGRSVSAGSGTMTILEANRPQVTGDLDLDISGQADAIAELASLDPIDGLKRTGFDAQDFSGTASGKIKARIPLYGNPDTSNLEWLVSLRYQNLAIAKPVDGQMFSDATGTLVVDPRKAVVAAKAKLNGAPAEVSLVTPFDQSVEKSQKVEIVLDDKAREKMAPGLAGLITGPVRVSADMSNPEAQKITADLTDARLSLPWAGWSKGAGIAGDVSFTLDTDAGTSKLTNFKLRGKTFAADGDVTLDNGSFRRGAFSMVKLNRDDDARVTIDRIGKTLKVDIAGKSFDVRSIVDLLTKDAEGAASSAGGGAIDLSAKLSRVSGFNNETMTGIDVDYRGTGSRIDSLSVTATTASGALVRLLDKTESGQRRTEMQSSDAGAVLRFLDLYDHMQGGAITVTMTGAAGGTMKGQIDATNFLVVDEPKLASIVASRPANGGTESLNQAVDGGIDSSRVRFERGFATVEKGPGRLALQNGVLRGPSIGTTFQGTAYDKAGNIAITGTFMPAYGVNRIFGELPLVGALLGNGRDRGLIGVTYKLTGKAVEPHLQINPLSLIAPGIFRSIFEYR